MTSKTKKILAVLSFVLAALFLGLTLVTSPLYLSYVVYAPEKGLAIDSTFYSALAFYLAFGAIETGLLIVFGIELLRGKANVDRLLLWVELLLGVLVLYLLGAILLPVMNLKDYLLLVFGLVPGALEIPLLAVSFYLLEKEKKKVKVNENTLPNNK